MVRPDRELDRMLEDRLRVSEGLTKALLDLSEDEKDIETSLYALEEKSDAIQKAEALDEAQREKRIDVYEDMKKHLKNKLVEYSNTKESIGRQLTEDPLPLFTELMIKFAKDKIEKSLDKYYGPEFHFDTDFMIREPSAYRGTSLYIDVDGQITSQSLATAPVFGYIPNAIELGFFDGKRAGAVKEMLEELNTSKGKAEEESDIVVQKPFLEGVYNTAYVEECIGKMEKELNEAFSFDNARLNTQQISMKTLYENVREFSSCPVKKDTLYHLYLLRYLGVDDIRMTSGGPQDVLTYLFWSINPLLRIPGDKRGFNPIKVIKGTYFICDENKPKEFETYLNLCHPRKIEGLDKEVFASSERSLPIEQAEAADRIMRKPDLVALTYERVGHLLKYDGFTAWLYKVMGFDADKPIMRKVLAVSNDPSDRGFVDFANAELLLMNTLEGGVKRLDKLKWTEKREGIVPLDLLRTRMGRSAGVRIIDDRMESVQKFLEVEKDVLHETCYLEPEGFMFAMEKLRELKKFLSSRGVRERDFDEDGFDYKEYKEVLEGVLDELESKIGKKRLKDSMIFHAIKSECNDISKNGEKRHGPPDRIISQMPLYDLDSGQRELVEDVYKYVKLWLDDGNKIKVRPPKIQHRLGSSGIAFTLREQGSQQIPVKTLEQMLRGGEAYKKTRVDFESLKKVLPTYRNPFRALRGLLRG